MNAWPCFCFHCPLILRGSNSLQTSSFTYSKSLVVPSLSQQLNSKSKPLRNSVWVPVTVFFYYVFILHILKFFQLFCIFTGNRKYLAAYCSLNIRLCTVHNRFSAWALGPFLHLESQKWQVESFSYFDSFLLLLPSHLSPQPVKDSLDWAHLDNSE